MALTSLILALVTIASDPSYSPAVRGTVWIRAGDKAVGTGWVVDVERRWVITARHVLADRDKVEVFLPDYRDGKLIADRVHYLSERADLLKRARLATGKLVAKNDNADLALLALDQMPADVPALKLSSRPPKPGHECSCVGHRHDAELLWNRTTGWIRQVGHLSEGYFWAGTRIGAKAPVLFVQSPIELGESGAAIVDDVGKVIGVVSAVSNRTPRLAIAINVSEVQKLLTDARQDSPVIKVTQGVEKRPDVAALMNGSVWVRPRSTEGRAAGVMIDHERKLVLTTAAAVGVEEVVDVVLPKWDKDRLVAEASEYQDLLGLRLSKHCVQGVVLARDRARDLALIELEVWEPLDEIPLAATPKMGDRIAALSHPSNEELMWLYAAGTVRSVGKVKLSRDGGDEAAKVMTSMLQLPHEGSASGGPVVNERGELVGILASREGTRQELAYAVTPEEIQEFLKAVRPLWKPDARAEYYERTKLLVKRGQAKMGMHALYIVDPSEAKDTLYAAYSTKVLAQGGNSYDAEQIINLIEEKLQASPEVNSLLAEACAAFDDNSRARKFMDAALKENPKLASALVLRAELRPGKQAKSDIDEALAQDPTFARAYFLRASMHDPKDPEQVQKALADLTRAIELEPYDSSFRARRADLQLETKGFKKAVSDFTRLTELEPLKADWYFKLGNATFLGGDRASAIRHYVSALRIDAKRNAKRDTMILAAIRLNGKALQDDNATDFERIVDWYTRSLTAILPWVRGEKQQFLKLTLRDAAFQDEMQKRAGLLALGIEEAAKAE